LRPLRKRVDELEQLLARLMARPSAYTSEKFAAARARAAAAIRRVIEGRGAKRPIDWKAEAQKAMEEIARQGISPLESTLAHLSFARAKAGIRVDQIVLGNASTKGNEI